MASTGLASPAEPRPSGFGNPADAQPSWQAGAGLSGTKRSRSRSLGPSDATPLLPSATGPERVPNDNYDGLPVTDQSPTSRLRREAAAPAQASELAPGTMGLGLTNGSPPPQHGPPAKPVPVDDANVSAPFASGSGTGPGSGGDDSIAFVVSPRSRQNGAGPTEDNAAIASSCSPQNRAGPAAEFGNAPAPHTNGVSSGNADRVNGDAADQVSVPGAKRRKIDAETDVRDSPCPPTVTEPSPGGTSAPVQVQVQVQAPQEVDGPKQPASTPNQLSASQSVDLTNDDSAAPTKMPDLEEVCIGMIHTIIICSIAPSPKPGQKSVLGDEWMPAVKIVLKRLDGDATPTVSGYDHTRKIVGCLDNNTSKCLAPLFDAGHIGLRAECRIPSQRKAPGRVPGGDIPEHAYPLEAILYCRLRFARPLGRHLLEHRIMLVSPHMVPNGTRIANPHTREVRPNFHSPKPPPPPGEVGEPSQPALVRSVEEIRSEVMGVFDSLATNEELPLQEPSAVILTPLLKHQKQALFFLLNREKGHTFQLQNKHMASFWKVRTGPDGEKLFRNVITGQEEPQLPPVTLGGILADMMGLGKTLSILSLIVSSAAPAANWIGRDPMQPEPQAPLPTSRRWGGAAAHALPPLGLTPIVRNVKATLLVCPLSTVANWEEQIKQHVEPGRLRYHVYHGPNRLRDVDELAGFDLVITTYGSVASELGSRSKGKSGTFPLEELGWFRIVLDEAHMIREPNTLQFKSICRLQANRRWAVTGTPVQNRLDDFAALLAFLRLKPFDDRSKFNHHIVEPFKSCDPRVIPKLRVLVDAITLRRLKDKIDLPARTDHIVRLEFSPEEKEIYDLFAKNAQDRVRALAGHNARALGGNTYIHILRSILRLRLLCAHGKDLLNDADTEALQGMSAELAINIDEDEDDSFSSGGGGASGAGLTERKAYEMFCLMQDTNNDSCVGCSKKLASADDANAANIESESPDDVVGYMNPCFHVLCGACIQSFQDRCRAAAPPGSTQGPCPLCQAVRPFVFVELRRARADAEHEPKIKGKSGGIPHAKQIGAYSGPHTKTRALVEELLSNKRASAQDPSEPPFKSVIFSGWTSHLDLIQMALDPAGITYTRLDGSMNRVARSLALDTFRNNPDIQVILVSINAGGLGLNLTTANSVFVMEPQFNPAAEAQAVDRVHRLGQKRPVRTVRFIMRGSFEEKMLELQDKKTKLASLSMDGKGKSLDKAEAAREKLMDLRSLFK